MAGILLSAVSLTQNARSRAGTPADRRCTSAPGNAPMHCFVFFLLTGSRLKPSTQLYP